MITKTIETKAVVQLTKKSLSYLICDDAIINDNQINGYGEDDYEQSEIMEMELKLL